MSYIAVQGSWGHHNESMTLIIISHSRQNDPIVDDFSCVFS